MLYAKWPLDFTAKFVVMHLCVMGGGGVRLGRGPAYADEGACVFAGEGVGGQESCINTLDLHNLFLYQIS